MLSEDLDRVRSEINAKIEEFLSRGGEIQEIRAGKLGYKQSVKRSEWIKDIAKKTEP
ncbi:hypothetical protein [Pseudomonas sp. 30_B]|uniref:hypothetical protein n=1 Tax=Pseudomonas sp. 30_B TaxID=2813575 RepID=UPI0034D1C4BD